MQPLDTYIKNRKNYTIPRPAYYRRWWNVRICYRRMYRELSYDFKHAKMDKR